jgi:phage protein D
VTQLWDATSRLYRRVSDPIAVVRVLGSAAANAPNLDDRIIEVKVKAQTGRMAKAEITFWNEDNALSDSAVLAKGTQLRIQYGYSGWLSKPRTFRIKKLKGTKARIRNIGRVTVEAYSSAEALHGSKRGKRWNGLTDNQIAAQIARANNLKTLLSPDDNVRRTRIQSNQTDAQFLAEIAQKRGYLFNVENDTLIFASTEEVERIAPVAVYTYYVEGEGHGWVLRFEPESNIFGIAGAVRVVSRDPKTGQRVEYTAKISDRKDRVLGRHSELVADGDVEEARRTSTALHQGATPDTVTVNRPNLTLGQCKDEAQKRLRQMQSRTLRARAGLIGNPDTWERQLIQMHGVGKQMSGLWRITEVEHEIGRRGYMMLLKVRRDGLSSKPKGTAPSQTAKSPSVATALTTAHRKQQLPTAPLAQSGVQERSRFVRR